MMSCTPARTLRHLVRSRLGASAAADLAQHVNRTRRNSSNRVYSTSVPVEIAASPALKPLMRSIHSDLQVLEQLFALLTADSPLGEQLTSAVERLERCHDARSCIFVTGIGKSGIVARRLASTLASISIRSQWIHGGEWVHGDLGSLQPGDVVVIFSHSGNTSELTALPAIISKRQCDTIAIVGHDDSHLARDCSLAVAVPALDDSSCPVPSRSIIAQEAISNAIIEYLVDTIDNRATEFQANHPGGSIGDRFARP